VPEETSTEETSPIEPEPETDPVVQELKQLNRILKIGFTGILLFKLLELLVKLVLYKKRGGSPWQQRLRARG
jgi:hypothetical protein